jgi:hypothetical protein
MGRIFLCRCSTSFWAIVLLVMGVTKMTEKPMPDVIWLYEPTPECMSLLWTRDEGKGQTAFIRADRVTEVLKQAREVLARWDDVFTESDAWDDGAHYTIQMTKQTITAIDKLLEDLK